MKLSLNQKVLILVTMGLFFFLAVFFFTPRSEWVNTANEYGVVRTLVSSGSTTSGTRIGAVIDLESGQTAIINAGHDCNIVAGVRVHLSVQANTKNAQDRRYSCLNVVTN